MEYKKPLLRNGEIVTPLGTFSEAVAERKTKWKIYILFIIWILCILFLFIIIFIHYGDL